MFWLSGISIKVGLYFSSEWLYSILSSTAIPIILATLQVPTKCLRPQSILQDLCVNSLCSVYATSSALEDLPLFKSLLFAPFSHFLVLPFYPLSLN